MPLDSVCISAVVEELRRDISGMRIDKVQQPERDEIILSLRGAGKPRHLLICAGAGDCRIHFTDFQFENPQQPPMFCMLLRKHIAGARIKNITQPGLERAANIELSFSDSLGDISEKHLIIEMMGRYSNIILTGEDGIIIDCLRRVDIEMSEKRQVLPGLLYRLPPPQEKSDPRSIDEGMFSKLLKSANPERSADAWLLDAFLGLSPLVCREVVFSAYGDTDMRMRELMDSDGGKKLIGAFVNAVRRIREKDFEPFMLEDSEGKPADFSYMPLAQYGGALSLRRFDSFSSLLEEFYTRRDRAQRTRQRASSLIKTAKNARDRVQRRLISQKSELEATKGRERLREFGDIITANLHVMEKGMTSLKAEDFYAENGEMCEIRLDERKTPQQNAAKYYKDYTKARNAEKHLSELIGSGEMEFEYLSSVLEEISRAENESDLEEIRRELVDAGYMRSGVKGSKEKKRQAAPMLFISSAGVEIRAGRNNIQNDMLALKASHKTDIWLHAQKIHGAHVVISSFDGETDDITLMEAANLAACFSQAGGGAKVPVDFTRIKYVKKPAGARPGMVVYTDYKTLYVKPDIKLAERLRKQ